MFSSNQADFFCRICNFAKQFNIAIFNFGIQCSNFANQRKKVCGQIHVPLWCILCYYIFETKHIHFNTVSFRFFSSLIPEHEILVSFSSLWLAGKEFLFKVVSNELHRKDIKSKMTNNFYPQTGDLFPIFIISKLF